MKKLMIIGVVLFIASITFTKAQTANQNNTPASTQQVIGAQVSTSSEGTAASNHSGMSGCCAKKDAKKCCKGKDAKKCEAMKKEGKESAPIAKPLN